MQPHMPVRPLKQAIDAALISRRMADVVREDGIRYQPMLLLPCGWKRQHDWYFVALVVEPEEVPLPDSLVFLPTAHVFTTAAGCLSRCPRPTYLFACLLLTYTYYGRLP